MSERTVSLHRLESVFGEKKFAEPTMVKIIPSFFVEARVEPKYVKPNFSSETKVIKRGRRPKIILVGAAGATGKSDFTRYLSAALRIPVMDLARHAGVGANSLTGLFVETLGPVGLGTFITDLQRGNAAMIIDALDEGHMKTHVGPFNAFLDEIADIAKGAEATPFVMLGRNNIVDDCVLHFWSKGLEDEVELLHIEPFTENQACEFIDNRVEDLRYGADGKVVKDEIKFNDAYKTVRDHIISSIKGFFKHEGDINKGSVTTSSQMFIGYAPVLLSISELLKKGTNYQVLYQELTARGDKGVDLIIDIARMIMERDRSGKILPVIREDLLKGRPSEFVDHVEAVAYSEQEQCVRILHFLMNETPSMELTEDKMFNKMYEEKATEWLHEHPFINRSTRRFQNVVFECYAIAKLMLVRECEELVLRYLRRKSYKDAFMLFFIFEKLCISRQINPLFLPYLYNSFKSLDGKENAYSMEITAASGHSEEIENVYCDVEFGIAAGHGENYEFQMSVRSETELSLFGDLANVDINAPINVLLNGGRVELGSPVYITCSGIKVDLAELVIEAKGDGDVQIEAEQSFVVDYNAGNVPEIYDFTSGKANLYIISEHKPDFPFSEYYVDPKGLESLDGSMKEKYERLRKILMQFRTHGRNGYAKLKDKIENIRIKGNGFGAGVLEKLKEKGIIWADGHLYKLNMDAMNEHLGTSYQALQGKAMSEKVKEFLKAV